MQIRPGVNREILLKGHAFSQLHSDTVFHHLHHGNFEIED